MSDHTELAEPIGKKPVGLGGGLTVAIILSALVVPGFLLVAFKAIDELQYQYFPLCLILAGLHVATIVLVLQKKKLGRIVGIIAWIPLFFSLFGIWALPFYIRSERVKNTLIQ